MCASHPCASRRLQPTLLTLLLPACCNRSYPAASYIEEHPEIEEEALLELQQQQEQQQQEQEQQMQQEQQQQQ